MFKTKTYVVQQATGTVVAVKLTFEAAHKIAKRYAPARVLTFVADKTDRVDEVHVAHQSKCS